MSPSNPCTQYWAWWASAITYFVTLISTASRLPARSQMERIVCAGLCEPVTPMTLTELTVEV